MTLTHNQFVALFGGGADGGEVPSGPVQLSVIFVATQFVFKWKAPATSTVVFHWGDNTTSEVSGNDLTEVITTSSYTSAGTCNVWLTGDVADITYIDVSGQAFVSGDTDTWVAAITGLTHIDVSDTGMTGDASLFAAFSLTTFNFDSSSLTWESNTAMSLTSATVNAASSGMNTSTQVDNFIDSVKAGTGCTYNVAGTNAHRTAASNDDLNTLLANGNTITLNDVLGAELHTSLNAANDSATEAITAFADHASTIDGSTSVTIGESVLDMIPKGAELISTGDCINVDYTSFGSATPTGFNATSNGAGTQEAGTADELVIVAGKYYIVKFTEVLNSDTAPFVDIRTAVGGTSITDGGNQSSADGSNSLVFRAKTTTTGVIQFSNVTTNTDVEITSISVKELQVLGSDLVTGGSFTLGADLNVNDCENAPTTPYGTFTGASPTAFNAANGAAIARAGTADEISIVSGQKYVVTLDAVNNGGVLPSILLRETIEGAVISNVVVVGIGANVIELTANATTTGVLAFSTTTTADYEITNLSVKDADTDWTYGTNWIGYGGVAAHTSGAASPITQNIGLDAGDYFLIKITTVRSAGLYNITFGGNSVTGWSSTAGTLTIVGQSTGNSVLYVYPNTDFIGSIDNVSVHKLTWTKEIAASTNYTGTHYALPIDENNLAIPVDYTAEAISAQLMGGESNATTGFTSVSLDGTGANVFESQDTTVNTGEFAIHANCEDTNTASARFYVDLEAAPFSIIDDDVVRISITGKQIGSGGGWDVKLHSDNAAGGGSLIKRYISAVGTFVTTVYYFTHSDSTRYFVVRESNGGNDGGVYIDNYSLKKVTLS